MSDILRRVPAGAGQKTDGTPRIICKALNGEPPPADSESGQEWLRKLRNIERHLQRTADQIPDLCTANERGRRYYWWESHRAKENWLMKDAHYGKGIGRQVAFSLLNRHLNELLPPEIQQELSPLIEAAQKQLPMGTVPGSRKYRHLEEKVELFFQPLPMQPEKLDPVIRENIFSAVLDERVIEADYQSNYDNDGWSGRLTLSLQKLVFKYNHLKVQAYNHANQQVRELTASKLMNVSFATSANYVVSQLKPLSEEIVLRTTCPYFYKGYFKSVRISKDQRIEKSPDTDGWLIKFTLPLNPKESSGKPDYFDLVNQLSAWADQLEVVSPPELRDAMKVRIKAMVERYGLSGSDGTST